MSKAQGIAQSANQGQFKNRIINGAMMIDQRNAGASVTLTSSAPYIVDRFFGFKDTTGATVTAQRSTISPTGFINSIGVTVSTGSNAGAADQNMIQQGIEGLNISDLGWGTANAQSVTLSFWVRSSVTGTYGIGISNGAANRCYVASYVINSANTWEYKTITIAGDTSGTWATDNGMGIRLRFDYGSGSNFQGTAGSWGSTLFNTVSGRANLIGTTGATWYVTGVQLEKGSTATSFDYRPYGTELALCQRYCQVSSSSFILPLVRTSDARRYGSCFFKQTMRAAPTISAFTISLDGASGSGSASDIGVDGFGIDINPSSSAGSVIKCSSYTASAEL